MRRALVIGVGVLTAAAVVAAALALSGCGGGDAAENAPATPPAPRSEPPAIQPVDGSTASPWPAGVFRPTNVFVRTTGHVDEVVYAGASGQNPRDGMIAAREESGHSGVEEEKLSTARGTGALRLTSVAGRTVRFKSESGRTGSYDLDRHRLRLDKKPGMQLDCIREPCPGVRP
jgi:hypothetical protein